MKMKAPLLTVIALSLAAAPAWSAKKKSVEQVIEEGKKAADNMQAELAAGEEAGKQEMYAYWDALPAAEPVVPGQLLSKLKTLPWPDPRPVPKEKYLERPVVKARELTEEEGDPLLAGLAKKEDEVKNELEAAQRESDEARYGLWLENLGFFRRGVSSCEAGDTAGAERVKLLEAARVFIKEGVPRFYLKETTEKPAAKDFGGMQIGKAGGKEKADAGDLKALEKRVTLLVSSLYRDGEYIPDYRSMLWAEQAGGKLAAGLSGISEKEKQRYYKIIARIRDFDPRAPQAEAAGGGALAGAPAGGAARDAKWEQFLQGLVGQCNKTISGLNLATAQPSQYKELGDRAEQALRKMLASFPPGWQKYPRAKWAHNWFSSALDKAAADPAARGMAIFKALDSYEAGLGPERE